jgi:hypothetical protein
MKRQWKPWLYVAAVLCMSVSCKKDELDDGSSCGPPSQELTFLKTLQNARADVADAGLVLENDGFVNYCIKQERTYEPSQLETTYLDFKPQPFKYRVWGKLYNCDNCPVYGVGMRVWYIRIDKIERVIN